MKKNKVLVAIIAASFMLSACSAKETGSSAAASSAATLVSSLAASASNMLSSEPDKPKAYESDGVGENTAVNTGIDALGLGNDVSYQETGTDLVVVTKENCSAEDANDIISRITDKYVLFGDLKGTVKITPDKVKDNEEYRLSAHYLNSKKDLCLMYIQYVKDNDGTYTLQIQMQKQNQ